MDIIPNAQPSFNSVLLIDDDYIANIYNQKILEVASFSKNIVAQKSGFDALDYLAQNTLNLPDVIFLDIRMPGMDGFEFLETYDKMKESFIKSPKIIMLSSTLDDKDKQRALKSTSVTSLFEKPLNDSKVKEIISLLSGEHSKG